MIKQPEIQKRKEKTENQIKCTINIYLSFTLLFWYSFAKFWRLQAQNSVSHQNVCEPSLAEKNSKQWEQNQNRSNSHRLIASDYTRYKPTPNRMQTKQQNKPKHQQQTQTKSAFCKTFWYSILIRDTNYTQKPQRFVYVYMNVVASKRPSYDYTYVALVAPQNWSCLYVMMIPFAERSGRLEIGEYPPAHLQNPCSSHYPDCGQHMQSTKNYTTNL